METQFDVVFSGTLRPDVSVDDAIRKLMAISTLSQEKAETILASGRPVIMKKAVSHAAAQALVHKLADIGLQMHLVETTPAKPQAVAPQFPPMSSFDASSVASAENDAGQAAVQATTAPPGTPAADMAADRPSAESFFPEPQRVRAGHGWKWLPTAARLFIASPWKWLGMCLTVYLFTFLMNVIPMIGPIINPLLHIVFGGGLMLGAQSLHNGAGLKFSHVFGGFTGNRNQLLLLGLYYLLGLIAIFLLIGGISFLALGKDLLAMILMGDNHPDEIGQALQQNLPLLCIALLSGLACWIPLLMAVWFSTCLVAIEGLPALTAMKLSFRACWTNMLPLLVYGLAALLLGILIVLACAVVVGILAALTKGENSLIMMFVPLLFLLLCGLPVIVILGLSVFTGYRDIFYRATNRDRSSPDRAADMAT